jgi:nucleoside-diphosphate-sugar epimerase
MAFARIISSMNSKSPFKLFGDGSQIRDFTYVGDVAEANLLALSTPLGESKVLNISGGASASMLEALRIFEEIRPGALKILQSEPVAGDVLQTGGSNRLAGEVLGWTPQIDLPIGILSQVESVL